MEAERHARFTDRSHSTGIARLTTRQTVSAIWDWTRGKVDRDLVWTSAGRLLILLAGIGSAIITARTLDPSARGAYFLATSTAQAIAQVGTFGLVSSNTYLLAANQQLIGRLLGNSVCVSLVVGVAGAAAVVTLVQPGGYFWWTLLLAPATLFWVLGTNLLVAQGRIRDYNWFQLAANMAVFSALALVAVISARVTTFLTAATITWVAASIALLASLRPQTSAGVAAFDSNVFRAGVAYSLRAYLATLFGYAVLRSQVFLLSALRPASELGQYSIAVQAADVLAILPQSAALLLFPQLVAMPSGRRLRAKEVTIQVGTLLAFACAFAWIAGPTVLTLVFGEAYEPAGGILQRMLPGVICLGLATLLSQYLAASGMPIRLVAVWAAAAGLALASGSWLIAAYGADGAAWTYSLAHAFVLAGVCWLVSARHTTRE